MRKVKGNHSMEPEKNVSKKEDLRSEKEELAIIVNNLEHRIKYLQNDLKIKESLQMTKVLKRKIPQPYYNQWVKDANHLLISLVNLKRRLSGINNS